MLETGINYFEAVFQVGAVVQREIDLLNFNTKMGYFFDSLRHYKIKKVGRENNRILVSMIDTHVCFSSLRKRVRCNRLYRHSGCWTYFRFVTFGREHSGKWQLTEE